MPTYHLASVVDDHEMEITHVLRGEVSQFDSSHSPSYLSFEANSKGEEER